MSDLVIGIPTNGRSGLLGRMLESLAACRLPGNLKQVLVVENGEQDNSREVAMSFQGQLPMAYLHLMTKGKNHALNALARAHPESFLLFFDDDIRLHPDTLMAYSEAVRKLGKGIFLGGRCHVEYETPPLPWVVPYLPFSAKGWSKGDSPQVLTTAEAMGFNWGAWAPDIIACGMFNTNRGPGVLHSIGDETEMQEQLLERKIKGHYLPDAEVWHYVPAERCSAEWAINRARQMGIARGLSCSRQRMWERVRLPAVSLYSIFKLGLGSRFLGPLLGVERHFYMKRQKNWYLGVLQGLKLSRKILSRNESA